MHTCECALIPARSLTHCHIHTYTHVNTALVIVVVYPFRLVIQRRGVYYYDYYYYYFIHTLDARFGNEVIAKYTHTHTRLYMRVLFPRCRPVSHSSAVPARRIFHH
uniref:Uncharacterized protein n=1 Tax=Sipha flava TaxID=143950 RepID=A0A2S2Q919_9HEMI